MTGHILELVRGTDAILVPIGPCCGDLQSLFGDHIPFSFYHAISGDAETCSVGQYKVANCQISLIFRRGIKLFAPLAPGGWLNPIPNLILSPSMLERYPTRRTRMSLRVTKCHRAAIFDGAYLGARANYGCDSNSYRTMLRRPTITSLTFWRSHIVFILRHHLG